MSATHLQDLLTASAERDPSAVALVGVDETLSYGELETLTNRMAHALVEHGCRPGDRVCVLAEKTPATVASLIATLKAGGVYVPIDSASPSARIARIVTAAEPSLLVADSSAGPLVDEVLDLVDSPVVGSLDGPLEGERFRSVFGRADLGSLPVEAPAVAGVAGASGDTQRSGEHADRGAGPSTELAHLLFTSGSTGVPKGVMITHANVLAFVEWALAHFGTSAGDRISGHPPLHFDLSTFDIYATFAAGAELHLFPARLAMDPRGTAAFIRDRALTQWFSVPSVLTFLSTFDAVAQDDFPALERLLWCGEVLPTPVLAHWMRRLPHVRFTNLYGPTEATIASSVYDVPAVPADETVPVPIGTACAGEELVVRDREASTPAPVGEIGDLYIGGVGLSPGYWRDEEKTAAVFSCDAAGRRLYRTGDLARVDADGTVAFLGRADSQIKSRGYRIELGEIEAALGTVDGIGECAVVGVDLGGFEGTTICCAFAAAEGRELEVPGLRAAVARLVPAYMVPTRWERLDALPQNVNGKIDRPALRERFTPARPVSVGGR